MDETALLSESIIKIEYKDELEETAPDFPVTIKKEEEVEEEHVIEEGFVHTKCVHRGHIKEEPGKEVKEEDDLEETAPDFPVTIKNEKEEEEHEKEDVLNPVFFQLVGEVMNEDLGQEQGELTDPLSLGALEKDHECEEVNDREEEKGYQEKDVMGEKRMCSRHILVPVTSGAKKYKDTLGAQRMRLYRQRLREKKIAGESNSSTDSSMIRSKDTIAAQRMRLYRQRLREKKIAGESNSGTDSSMLRRRALTSTERSRLWYQRKKLKEKSSYTTIQSSVSQNNELNYNN